MTTFVDAAESAFADLSAKHGWSLDASSESEWFASIALAHGASSLKVSDDRRDRMVEVIFERPVIDQDFAFRLLAAGKGRFRLPLWAVVVAAGGSERDAVASGDGRIDALPRLAVITEQYGGRILSGDWSEQDAAYAVMESHQHDNSEEGRRARRFLP